MTLPISKIEEFEVGQVLELAGTTVGSVTLVGADGKPVATARLGQVAGKRAVRVEPEQVQLQEDAAYVTAAKTQPDVEVMSDVGDLVES